MKHHPDVVAYARFLDLGGPQRLVVEHHLELCGECRDLVLFIRKTIATLGSDGMVAKVAQALDMDIEELKRHMDLGTPIGKLIAERALLRRTLPLTPSGQVDYKALAGRFGGVQPRAKTKPSVESTRPSRAESKTDKGNRNAAEALETEVERLVRTKK